MCGIVAELGGQRELESLLRGVSHRGPDAQRTVLGSFGGVAAARLRVVGGASSDQPIRSTCGRLALVFNGEVFNHRELGLSGPGTCDVHGLPDRLVQWGPSYLSNLRGPFALAAYDLWEDSLLLARDEESVRPLFVREGRASVSVASEIAPLQQPGDSLDDIAWDHLLAFQFWPPDRTAFAAIRPVLPGTWCRYHLREKLLQREEGSFRCEAPSHGDIREHLFEALRLQGAAQVPTAATLSGGLDSSGVVGGLAHVGCPVDFAAVGFFDAGGPSHDERVHARQVALELHLPLHEVRITREAFLDAWPRLLRATGGPVGGPGGPAQWIVSELLASLGARVVFSGQGGDELFGGYERYRLTQQWDSGERLVPASGYEPLLVGFDADPARHLLFRGKDLLPFLSDSRRARVVALTRILPRPERPLTDRLVAFERRVILPGLLTIEDRTHSAFGMEGRVPLLDPVLARAASAIPMASKSPPAAQRRLFREIMGRALPSAAAKRKDKMGFPVPLEAWFRGRDARHLLERIRIEDLDRLDIDRRVLVSLERGLMPMRMAYFLTSISLFLQSAPISLPTEAQAS